MQRAAQSPVPPRKNNSGNGSLGNNNNMNNAQQSGSPAFMLAIRIKNEQGPQRAAQYLLAMEPFIAPAERAHIASRLGLPPPPKQTQNRQNSGGQDMPFSGAQGMNDTMNLLRMFSSMKGKSGGGGMPDPALMSKLMGMMGKK